MRRLYIAPKSVWFTAAHAGLFHRAVGSHYIDLVAPSVAPATYAEITALVAGAGHALANDADALVAFEAANGGTTNMVLISTDFSGECAEDCWHGHPAVAVLPHPAFEGTTPVMQFMGSGTKRLATRHITALRARPAMNFLNTDTVLDIGRKAAAIHPQVRLRGIL